MNKDHLYRVDLEEVYEECERRTAYKYKILASQVDIDDFVITRQEYKQIHDFAMEAAARISNSCSYVKNETQSGIDAISWNLKEDKEDTQGREATQGEKLHRKEMTDILFDIEGVDDQMNMYSVVQQFIKSAMIHYILYSWYALKGFGNEAQLERVEYEQELGNVKHNAVNNNRRKSVKRPYRPFF